MPKTYQTEKVDKNLYLLKVLSTTCNLKKGAHSHTSKFYHKVLFILNKTKVNTITFTAKCWQCHFTRTRILSNNIKYLTLHHSTGATTNDIWSVYVTLRRCCCNAWRLLSQHQFFLCLLKLIWFHVIICAEPLCFFLIFKNSFFYYLDFWQRCISLFTLFTCITPFNYFIYFFSGMITELTGLQLLRNLFRLLFFNASAARNMNCISFLVLTTKGLVSWHRHLYIAWLPEIKCWL